MRPECSTDASGTDEVRAQGGRREGGKGGRSTLASCSSHRRNEAISGHHPLCESREGGERGAANGERAVRRVAAEARSPVPISRMVQRGKQTYGQTCAEKIYSRGVCTRVSCSRNNSTPHYYPHYYPPVPTPYYPLRPLELHNAPFVSLAARCPPWHAAARSGMAASPGGSRARTFSLLGRATASTQASRNCTLTVKAALGPLYVLR